MVSSLIFQMNYFWGGAHRAPSPDPSPRFLSGFALGSGFALNSRALCALDSGFALDTQALRALDSGFALILIDWGPWFGPPKINSWIRPWDREWLYYILSRLCSVYPTKFTEPAARCIIPPLSIASRN